MTYMKSQPIGIFDSGIGGLTVVREIVKLLPQEHIVYVGDTARVPYGVRGKEIITEFALQLTHYLLSHEVKFLVVACNTISAVCMQEIQKISPIPVIGVIEPAVKKIITTSRNQRVGIIGTPATIGSNVYETEIKKHNPAFYVQSVACPLFVPIAEEGLGNSDIARLTAQHYLTGLGGIDTLHLGCTHYPLLRNVIHEVMGDEVTIIDSALPTAEELQKVLTERNLLNTDGGPPKRSFYVTDAPERVYDIATIFFGEDIKSNIHKISL
jgi:glutamate racemase